MRKSLMNGSISMLWRPWTRTCTARVVRGIRVGAVVLGLAVSTSTQAGSLNPITGVRVEGNQDARVIRIATRSEPTFTVFRLSDPMRVIIDISGGDIAAVEEPLTVDDGLVNSVAARQFEINGFLVGRLTLSFEKEVTYDVSAEGHSVVVRASSSSEASPDGAWVTPTNPTQAAVSKGLARADTQAVGDVEQKSHELAEPGRRRDPGDRGRRGGVLKGVEERGDGILLRVAGRTSYELTRVEDPPRLVVRLDRVARKIRRLNHRLRSKWVRAVRLGDHVDATHAVFDLRRAKVRHRVETTDAGILVHFSGASRTSSPAGRSDSSGVAQVSSISFEGARDVARVVIDVPEDVQTSIDDRSRRAWVLKVLGARIEKTAEKSIDTSKSGSVVRLLSSYQASQDPATVNIVANLARAATQSLRRDAGQLIWEFRAIDGGKPEPGLVTSTQSATEEARQREGKSAAFRSSVSSMSRSIVPTQSGARRGRRVTLDFKDADIINVIRLIADTTGQNIIAADDVTGKVTVKLRNVPWERALDVILKSRGYDKVRSDGIIRIATADAIQAEREREIAKRQAQEQVEETVIKIVTVNYATATAIVDQLKPLLSLRGSVQVDSRTNAVIIEDVRSNISRLVDLTTLLDKQTPLVLIEARIVQATSNFEQEFGIQWGGTTQFTRANGNPTGLGFPSDVIISGASDDPQINPTQGVSAPGRYAVNLPAPIGAGAGGGLGFIFGSAGSDQLLQLRLSALETSGSGRIISSPRVTTLDNKTARIGQGVDIPITVVSAAGANTRLIPANLELEVTPHVTNDGSIVMEIKTTRNEPDFTNTGAQGDPSIVRNFAETEILVADGETAVIGGIYTRSTSQNVAKVPFLGDVPILGFFFRNERETDDRSELLVFITPRIVNRDEALGPTTSEMGASSG